MIDRQFLIRIDALPDPSDQRDLLELVLAAASLDLQVTVLLTGEGVELLSTQAWRQLHEQDLASVAVSGAPQGAALPAGIATIDSNERRKLEGKATVIRA